MIVLDTNVLSALMRRNVDPAVVAWLDDQPPESLWTTAVTVFEIGFGLAILADRRRRPLEDAFDRLLTEDFEGRILPFEQRAAQQAAAIAARRRKAGRPIGIRDAQIAGIVVARRGTLATRNTRHFNDLAVPLIGPWASA